MQYSKKLIEKAIKTGNKNVLKRLEKNQKLHIFNCGHCKEDFLSEKTKAIYCSDECRKIKQREFRIEKNPNGIFFKKK